MQNDDGDLTAGRIKVVKVGAVQLDEQSSLAKKSVELFNLTS